MQTLRWRHLFRQCTLGRVCLFLLLAIPLYNEFIVYIINSWSWNTLQSYTSKNDLRVLFVADPQIQGYEDELPILGYLTRWDADRYLYKTFTIAASLFEPDVVVYLGDILDEGSNARDEDYKTYVDRIHAIFKTNKHVKHIYISGDNDVGGEGFDPKTEAKVQRFTKFFHDKRVTNVKFVDFIKFEADFSSRGLMAMTEEVKRISSESQAAVKLLLSHMNILSMPRSSFQRAIRPIQPSIILSAHTHVARLYTCLECRSQSDSRQHYTAAKGHYMESAKTSMSDNTVYKFQLNDGVTLHEIVVPSCSYRMGVPNMGYGAAVIDSSGTMRYTIFWLPSRYHQVVLYAVIVCVILVAVLSYYVVRTAQVTRQYYRDRHYNGIVHSL